MSNALSALTSQKSQLLLTAEQERCLFEQLRSGGEGAADARAKIFDHNLGLVISIARSFGNRFLEDLVGEGAIGLNRAINRFDPRRGYKFSTYATHWIRQSIGRAVLKIYNENNVARLPGYLQEALKRLDRSLELSSQEKSDPASVALSLEITYRRAQNLIRVRQRRDLLALSLDAPAPSSSLSTTLKELLPEPQKDERRLELVEMLLDPLTELEIKSLWLTHGLQLSNLEAAHELGLEEPALRRLKVEAKRKIRERYPNFASVVLES